MATPPTPPGGRTPAEPEGRAPATFGETISTVEDELRLQLAKAETELSSLKEALDRSTTELRTQEGELGRLRAVEETAAQLRAELGATQEELGTLKASTDQRVTDAVRTALQDADATHQAAAARWNDEHTQLQQEITDLRGQLAGTGVTGEVAPKVLASQFASVLVDLAAQPASAGQYAAALTNLDVEARGVLHAPREGEDAPRLVTVEAGGVDPAQLSTIRMSFRLVPRIEEPTADG